MFSSTSSVATLSWIDRIAVPAWITAPDRTLLRLNAAALELFQCNASDCMGRRCYEVFRGDHYMAKDAEGRHPFCSPRCPVHVSLERGANLQVAQVCVVQGSGARTWMQLLPVPLEDEGGTRLLHCALPADRAHRLECYVEHLAERAPHPPWSVCRFDLSAREAEVLGLLAEDLNVDAIAEQLCVSYATVRNHIQHVLAKLGAHSVSQAIALYLLDRPEYQKSTSKPSRCVSPRISGSKR
ncbi:MAG TPA: PAS and helix-turn-helix domain-containing protein [Candidatus Eisenbacteria bacterium]|nr:PAS and helix-turn-helix domain-containing protein [Candidatus Eisenbacteria bacterium]